MGRIDSVGNPVGNISNWKYFQQRDWLAASRAPHGPVLALEATK